MALLRRYCGRGTRAALGMLLMSDAWLDIVALIDYNDRTSHALLLATYFSSHLADTRDTAVYLLNFQRPEWCWQ